MADNTQVDDSLTKYLPFIFELRKRLLFLLTIIVIASAIGFIYYKQVINLALKLFQLEGVNIVFTSPFQFISLAFTSAFLVVIVILLPLAILQLTSFLKPALHPKEFRILLGLIPFSILLFMSGFGFGIVIMRYVVKLFYEKSLELQIGNFLDISQLLSQVLITSVLMGMAFQYPVVLTILMKLGIVKYATIKKQRIWAYGASLVFSILLPPTDILSMLLFFLPLALLFECTLLLNRFLLKVS